MIKKCMFLHGPWNGELKEDPKQSYWEVPTHQSLEASYQDTNIHRGPFPSPDIHGGSFRSFETYRYRRLVLSFGAAYAVLYVPDEMDDEVTLNHIIQRLQP